MPRTLHQLSESKNLKELLIRLGNVPPQRVRIPPLPGQATQRDALRIQAHEGVLCELVEGVLVEKPMGSAESFLNVQLIRHLANYVEANDLGYLMGADGFTRLFPKLVRIPDASFTSWDRQPSHLGPSDAVTSVVPNLIVEVISPSNTEAEMEIKRREYFLAGVEAVWQVYIDTRTVDVYVSPEACRTFREGEVLSGRPVLPGFSLPISELFARVPKVPVSKRQKKRKRP